jgi:D-sedoheptulose 7-phosphate isomerase
MFQAENLSHWSHFIEKYPGLAAIQKEISSSHDLLASCFRTGNKVITCGNGGSAADSEHIVGELMKGFLLRRELTAQQKEPFQRIFPQECDVLTSNLQQAFPAISLVSAPSLSTAFGNDMNSDFIFAQQIFGIGKSGDVLIAISTSGNSKNVLWAAKVGKIQGIHVIGLTGENGGELAEVADICLKVPATNVVDIQELHLPVYHLLCMLIEETLFGKDKTTSFEVKLPEKVELIVFDFDGVFTNNKVYVNQDGVESVVCDRGDGLGIQMLKEAGIPMFILSTETNPVVSARANKLSIPVEFGCENKEVFLKDYFKRNNISRKNVIYVGNDLNDLNAMRLVAFSVAPADSHQEILHEATLVLKKPGGHGFVREFVEYLLNHINGE